MQTVADARKVERLGVSADRLLDLGNLKYGVLAESADQEGKGKDGSAPAAFGRAAKYLWVAGSTHSGEEEILLRAYKKLREDYDLSLIIAPRNIERGAEIASLAADFGFKPVRRSEGVRGGGDLVVLDTLGELAGVYKEADFAFIGGSLVRERGHNPLEPAVFAKPVVFGPHMEDFAEIADDLLKVGGAVRVDDEDALALIISKWISNEKERLAAGTKAAGLVKEQRGVTERYVELVARVIDDGLDR